VRAIATVYLSFFRPLLASFVIGLAGGLLRHARREAAALHHEAVDHAVEDRAVVVAGLHVVEEILRALRGFLLVELQRDHAVVLHVQFDFRVRHCGLLNSRAMRTG